MASAVPRDRCLLFVRVSLGDCVGGGQHQGLGVQERDRGGQRQRGRRELRHI